MLLIWACGGKAAPRRIPQSDFPAIYASRMVGGPRMVVLPWCLSQCGSIGQRLLDTDNTTGTYNGVTATQYVSQIQTLRSSCYVPANYESRIVDRFGTLVLPSPRKPAFSGDGTYRFEPSSWADHTETAVCILP